jgi:trehalose-6-phosphate synthase
MWLYAVVLTALTSATMQSYLDERRLLREHSQRIESLLEGIGDLVSADYRARKFKNIEKLAKRLDAQGLQTFSLCAYNTAGIWRPELSRHFLGPRELSEFFCQIAGRRLYPVQASAQALAQTPAQPRTWNWLLPLRGTQQETLYQLHARLYPSPATPTPFSLPGHKAGKALARGKPGQLALLVSQDLSSLRQNWLENMIRGFIITFLLSISLILLLWAQFKQWLNLQRNSLIQLVRSFFGNPEPVKVSAELYPAFLELLPSAGSSTESIENRELTVIANREPYIHERGADPTRPPRIIRPASGLVSALEPVLRQYGGMWIAHGSGSADFECCDSNGEIAVPPENPRYILKRVRLSTEAELGYYYGFSNEGLWPLCHLAHMRPIFRLSDWNQYCAVAERFTEAVPQKNLEAGSLILVQDYHFALVPRNLRLRAGASKPRIGIFWHIPWPNPETFGICPWGKELLQGMLGANVVGFHTQYHCNNFLETCNRYLEARIDWERFSVTMEGHETLVRAFPIGIDTSPIRVLSNADKEALKKKYGIQAEFIALGVDRVDYTKGLIERVESVERFLEKRPEFIGRFTLLQIGSPSRTRIAAYARFSEQLAERIDEVNRRFTLPENPDYKAILFLSQHHDWNEIQAFYQLGNICMVTSLHDGMNLVAKEYVWCQDPSLGSLILSKFTGASRELTEAFIVNPYNVEEMADAIDAALNLSSAERSSRMLSMKEKVLKQNAYQWASDQIQTLMRAQS